MSYPIAYPSQTILFLSYPTHLPTHLASVELECTPLDHGDLENDRKWTSGFIEPGEGKNSGKPNTPLNS